MLVEARPPPYNEAISQSRFMPDSRSQQGVFSGQQSFNTQPGFSERGRSSLAKTGNKLDFTQRLERKLAEYNASANPFKRWLFEILCWSISAICMGVIVVLYAQIRNRTMVDSDVLTITNALGKVASAALIVPTSEALGQLKWNWFSKSRAMWDFEIFDKASRGPLGAILLLFRTKGRSLAALGAVIIVLLLAIDTFFQQVVSLPERWALQPLPGTLPRVVNYKPYFEPVFQHGLEVTSEDRDIGTIGRAFFYANGSQSVPFGNGTRPNIPLTCPTSNCTWPLYETLAVCSRCADVTDFISPEYACMNTTIDWSAAWLGPLKTVPYPNGTVCGYFINATSSSPTLLSGYVSSENSTVTSGEALIVRAVPLTDFDTKLPLYGTGSIMFKDVRLPLLDALISTVKDGPESVYRNEAPVVHECMLTWCIQTMKSTYASGNYEEEILSTYIEPSRRSDSWPWDTWETETGTWLSYTQNLVIEPSHPPANSTDTVITNYTYKIDNYTQANIMNLFDDFFPSFYTAAHLATEPMLRHKNYMDGPKTIALKFNPWQLPNNVTRHMERMATSMTNTIRSSVSHTMVNGYAFQQETYISIQWEWLIFPFTLLFLSLVFLVMTIVKTSGDTGDKLWKTSAMPTLIYGLPKESQRQYATAPTWGSERKTRIKLLPNLGWRVSGQNQLANRSPRLPSGERVPRGWI